MAEVLRYAAFTDDPEGGNPAGVVLDAEGMSEARMQEIATEVGFSETAFATTTTPRTTDPVDRRFGLRFFSPVAEVAFCGHATVATAVALADRDGPGPLVLDTRAGEVRVETTTTGPTTRASIRSVPTRSRPATDGEVTSALRALRWSADDLAPAYPAHVAFAGNEHLVLAVGTRERLAELDYDFDHLLALMTARNWTTLQLFWEEDERTIHARNPFPVGGVVEDPATGAAAAALGGYLRELGRVPEARQLTIVQGVDMGRPSEILLEIHPDDPRVTVTGVATMIATNDARG